MIAAQRCDAPRDWLWDACLLATVRWGAHCKGTCSKKHPYYCIRRSTRKLLEQDQMQRVLWKSAHRTSNNQPRFTSLEIPWDSLPKLYCADLAEAYAIQEGMSMRFMCKERYDTQLPNGHLHQKTSAKSGNGKQTWYWVYYLGPTNVLLPGKKRDVCQKHGGTHMTYYLGVPKVCVLTCSLVWGVFVTMGY